MLPMHQSADSTLHDHRFSPPVANRLMIWPLGRCHERNPDATVVGNCAALAVSAPVITKDADIFQLGPSLELTRCSRCSSFFKYGNAVTQKRLIERAEDLGATNC
jgi:hypothetical protein